MFVQVGENRALSAHLGAGEGLGRLSLVPGEQSPERAVKQRKAMSKEGSNGRLQGIPGVALSCPALLSPGINIHCAAPAPLQEKPSWPCPRALSVLSPSHCRAAPSHTPPVPQDPFPRCFGASVGPWWTGLCCRVPEPLEESWSCIQHKNTPNQQVEVSPESQIICFLAGIFFCCCWDC